MNKVTLMDGAVGTGLWEKTDKKVAVWRFNMENPQIVSQLEREYVDAGAQIILANTFAANRPSMKGTPYTAPQIVSRAMDIAREAVAGRAKIALSIGPLPILLEPYGDLEADEAEVMFEEIIEAGVAGGADLIYAQTFMDLEMMKIVLRAAGKRDLPVFCSFSFDKTGHTMMGNTVRDILSGLKDLRVDAIGLNCSLGPDLALPVIKTFSENTDLPLIFKPNAGKPIGGAAGAEFDAETFVNDSLPALDYGVSYIGGCCGSNAKYIKRLGERLRELGGL